MEKRKCTKCNIEQDVDNFYVRKRGTNKRCSECKECQSKARARKIKHIPDLEGEIWTDFVGLEGIMLVGNTGRIKRIKHRKNPTNKIMKHFINENGYCQISLCHNGKYAMYSIHRSVALAFIPNPENKPEVNHKDGDKQNNHVDNLEWATESENIKHAWDTGLCKPKNGVDNGNSVLTEKEVLEIRAIKGMTKRDIAKLYNIGEAAVGKIINRQRWNHI